jgi:hypothetical protein
MRLPLLLSLCCRGPMMHTPFPPCAASPPARRSPACALPNGPLLSTPRARTEPPAGARPAPPSPAGSCPAPRQARRSERRRRPVTRCQKRPRPGPQIPRSAASAGIPLLSSCPMRACAPCMHAMPPQQPCVPQALEPRAPVPSRTAPRLISPRAPRAPGLIPGPRLAPDPARAMAAPQSASTRLRPCSPAAPPRVTAAARSSSARSLQKRARSLARRAAP